MRAQERALILRRSSISAPASIPWARRLRPGFRKLQRGIALSRPHGEELKGFGKAPWDETHEILVGSSRLTCLPPLLRLQPRKALVVDAFSNM
jgi:hypothetical protein